MLRSSRRHCSTMSALNCGVNDRRGRDFFRSVVSMVGILSGAAPPRVDVRQTGGSPCTRGSLENWWLTLSSVVVAVSRTGSHDPCRLLPSSKCARVLMGCWRKLPGLNPKSDGDPANSLHSESGEECQPPLVSFIVPTRNSERTLFACLASIQSQEWPWIELVVVDNSSTDATDGIARQLADVLINAGPERSAQRNAGARASHGTYLVFLDSDMVADSHLASDVVTAFGRDRAVGGLVLPEFAFGNGYLAKCRELEKRLYIGDPNVEAARAFRRSVFDEVGGYDEFLTGPEDWDLPDRVRGSGYLIQRTSAAVWHDEGTVRLRTAFRKKMYYGRSFPAYFETHGRSARRKLRRTGPLGQLPEIARQLHLLPGLTLLKVTEGAGLLAGMQASRRGSERSDTQDPRTHS